MKKNLAKRIVLGLLTGAVLMSSSVAWAAGTFDSGDGDTSIYVGYDSDGGGVGEGCIDSVAIGSKAQVIANSSVALGASSKVAGQNSVALGDESMVSGAYSVALGADANVGSYMYSVALGAGSIASEESVVSVGDGVAGSGGPDYRKIVNVAVGQDDHDAATVGQMEAITGDLQYSSSYYVHKNDGQTPSDNLTVAVGKLDAQVKANADAIANVNSNLVIKNQANELTGSVTINDGGNSNNPIVMDDDGITVGTNSARIDGTGFYVWDGQPHNVSTAKASMTKDGEIKGINGTFSGNVTATKLQISDGNGGTIDVETELGKKANSADVYKKTETYSQTEVDSKVDALKQVDLDLQTQINNIGGDNTAAIAGLNQRLEKTNAKINKVGAGAAALAALHPLDYDPDDKLTFSAGMGNYAGENAAALGAFYRPNEKFMLSLGGTMGNGENMVNLGLSIGLDKASGFAKMSKRELIQEVNAVKAENEAMKDQLANADERIAKLEALVAQLVAK